MNNNNKLGIDSSLQCWSPSLASISCPMGGLAHVDPHECYIATHVFTFVWILPVLTALHINNWTVGVAHSGCCSNEQSHHWVKPGRAVPTAVVEVLQPYESEGVHTSWDYSVLLARKLWSGHDNNSCRKREHKAACLAVLLTVLVSMTFYAL